MRNEPTDHEFDKVSLDLQTSLNTFNREELCSVARIMAGLNLMVLSRTQQQQATALCKALKETRNLLKDGLLQDMVEGWISEVESLSRNEAWEEGAVDTDEED